MELMTYLESSFEGEIGGTWVDVDGTAVVLRDRYWYRELMLCLLNQISQKIIEELKLGPEW